MLYDTLFLIKDQMVTSDSSYFFLKIFIFKKLIFFFFLINVQILMLSEKVLRQISINSGASFNFDFSYISSEYYESLFRTLQRYAIKNIESLGFNCDEQAKYESLVVKGSPLPKKVASSIARTKSNYIRNMVELICYVVPKSSKIQEIKFSNILIPRESLDRLAAAFEKSKTLKVIIFSRVLLENDGLQIFLNHLDPNDLISLSFVKCRLNDDVADSIIQFIMKKKSLFTGLKSFEVSPDEISEFVRQSIAEAIAGAFRKNQQRQISQPQSEFLSDNEDDELESIERQKILSQLKSENRTLKDQIKALKEMINAVKFGESMFVVGQGAPDFVMYLNDIEQRLVNIDGGR